VTPAEFMRRQLLDIARPADRNKVVVIRNGIARSSFTHAKSRLSPPVLLAVARLVEKKGIDTAILACRVLAERGTRVQLDIVGDGPLRAKLELLGAEVGSGAVRFLGAQRHQCIGVALARASVFVLPCRVARNGDCDTLPVAIVEALAAGVPVVTTAVGGIPELVQDSVTGMIVPPADPAAVADAVEKLLADSALCERLVSAGREATRPYELAANVDRLEQAFTRAAAMR
jgi:colanic acid/amylovoran biosynthesis glycosyltransferase